MRQQDFCGWTGKPLYRCTCEHCQPGFIETVLSKPPVEFTNVHDDECANCRAATEAGDLVARAANGSVLCLTCAQGLDA